ncbi:hypothetical protein HK103_003290 [Boothiomyces macroporosus]|uniref:Uncharacterized protein n=1 Tax=Boothiomyces macroporosus TaxID=261099 RepID=A0AAD5UCQ6_9FUNG|nr:hypothetical protein HK103_003290 [Boothiomyces macroporosus]KAJ3312436.1 hypothetical protein HDV04_003186 [Boothiomyces sp. JEL0838]
MDEQRPFLLYKGWVTIKRSILSQRRYIAICAPATIQDIQQLFEFLFVSDPNTTISMDEKSIPLLGNIAYSAVNATPFIVVMETEGRSEKPQFIHLDKLTSISDEVVLSTACTMCLHLPKGDVRITCPSSIDYQECMSALAMTYDMIQAGTVNPIQFASLQRPVSVARSHRTSTTFDFNHQGRMSQSLPKIPERPSSEKPGHNPLVRGYTEPVMQMPSGPMSPEPRRYSFDDEHHEREE